MGGDFILTKLIDRIRSGAKAHTTNRTTSRDSPVLPTSEPSRHDGTYSPSNTMSQPNKTAFARDGNKETLDSEKPATVESRPGSAGSNTQAEGEEPPALEPAKPPGDPSIPNRMWNGSKRFGRHTQKAICHSYVNILLVFVPIGIAVNFAKLNPGIIFAMNAVAIVPLAGLLSYATESVATRLGDTLGALLNVSFGNAVELIIL
jgi:Ca2+:H+ antiporter